MAIYFGRFQRLISVIMLALLMMSSATFSALAAEPDADSVDGAQDETMIVADADVEESAPEVSDVDVDSDDDANGADDADDADDSDIDAADLDQDVDEDDSDIDDTDLDQDVDADDVDDADDQIKPSDDDSDDGIDSDDDEIATDPDDVDSEEQIGVIIPSGIRVYSDNEDYDVIVSEDGTLTIEGLLKAFTTGGTANETIEMLVNGVYYSFDVYSDGTVVGVLPDGFSIVDGRLVITGYDEDLDIYIFDHRGVSSTFEEPVFPVNKPPSDVLHVTGQVSASEGNSSSYAAASVVAAAVETADDEDKDAKTPKIAPVVARETGERVLGAYEKENSRGVLPLAAGIVLSVGAVTGLGVLLKLKLFAA